MASALEVHFAVITSKLSGIQSRFSQSLYALKEFAAHLLGLHATTMEPSFGVVIGSFLPEIHLNVFAQYCFGECRIRTRGGCAASKRQINFAIASQANRSSNEKSETSCLANWVRKKKFFQGNVISPEKGINWLRRELSKSKPAKNKKNVS